MNEHSKKFALVKDYYDNELWSKKKVAKSVVDGWITPEEYEEITGEPYVEGTAN